MDLASRIPAKEAGHFPVNKPHDNVVVNDDVGRVEVVVHEAYIGVKIRIREDQVPF